MPYAMVLGEALIDLLEVADAAEPVYRAVVGGAPLNVAVGVSRLGGTAEFAGSLGDDALADRIHRFLTDNGVGTRGVQRVAAPTALAVTTFAGAEPDFRFYGTPPSYGLFDLRGLDAALPAGAAVLYCGSIALLCPALAAAAREAWAVTSGLRVFDPNVRPRLLAGADDLERQRAVTAEFAATADLVKLSAADAAVLYPGRPAEAVAGLLRELGAGAVVLTLGARGALVAAGPELLRVPAPAVAAIDATGAGDSVMAALIAELLAAGVPADPAQWRRRVEFALRVAALVCEAPGGATAMPTRAQVAARFGD